MCSMSPSSASAMQPQLSVLMRGRVGQGCLRGPSRCNQRQLFPSFASQPAPHPRPLHTVQTTKSPLATFQDIDKYHLHVHTLTMASHKTIQRLTKQSTPTQGQTRHDPENVLQDGLGIDEKRPMTSTTRKAENKGHSLVAVVNQTKTKPSALLSMVGRYEQRALISHTAYTFQMSTTGLLNLD